PKIYGLQETAITPSFSEDLLKSTTHREESLEAFTLPPTGATTQTLATLPETPQRNISLINATGACAMPNDKSDKTKLDVLFLLDTSGSIGIAQFQRAIKLVMDTVKNFKNIGPDGIQVSLVQFNHEPYLEFSFRKHNCKSELLEDIADTVYMNGTTNLGHAIDKVAKFGFNKRRVSAFCTDQFPSSIEQLVPKSTVETEITTGHEFTHSTPAEETSKQWASTPEMEQTTPSKEEGEEVLDHEKVIVAKPEEAQPELEETTPVAEEITQSSSELPTTITTESSEHISSTEDVSVQCLENGFNLTLRLPQSFGGVIIVKGKKYVRFSSKREMTGINTSAVVNVLHHKWLVTGVDKGYLIQCFVGNAEDVRDVSTELTVNGTIAIGETLSLASVPPTCIYSLRRDSPNGPIVKYASLGQIIYHRWECDGGDAANEVYGLHIHDCFAGSDTNREFPIIDSKGCSPDKSILSDLSYADHRLVASAKSSVFSLTDGDHLLFHCKLSLCTREGDGCEGITPPICSSSNDTDLLQREVRHFPEVVSAALTSVVHTNIVIESTGLLDASVVLLAAKSPWFWIFVILTVLSVLPRCLNKNELNTS
ncbi:unnamed protein product, partial [Toxocara canis]|uniref:ZP domain-containing protein n=1 Tax=Toxocara canis TaxID=6265 RepID=A0A183TW92_TOXCA